MSNSFVPSASTQGAVTVHCDDLIDDETQPKCLREYLRYNRLPAVCKQAGMERMTNWIEPDLIQYIWTDPEPILFADHNSERVRVVMASRFGDVGITRHLDARRGYDKRVPVSALSNFGTEPNGTLAASSRTEEHNITERLS